MKCIRLLLAVLAFNCTLSFANNIPPAPAYKAPTVAMTGIYTVNPAAAFSATNFIRIGQADTAMMNNGISGPVEIQIYNGTYNQTNMNLGVVAGSSAVNTITFTSFSGDSLQTQITSDFNFIGTSNIIIKKLNLTNLVINGNVSNYTITNNQITTFSWTGGSIVTLKNNYIKSQGTLRFASFTGSLIDNVNVESNFFQNMYYYVQAGTGVTGSTPYIGWSRVTKPSLKNNTFANINMGNVGYALIGCCSYSQYAAGATFQYDRCSDTAFVEGNKFNNITTDRFVHDIDLTNQNNPGPRLAHIVIRNNFFRTTGLLAMTPYSGGTAQVQFYYNNINNVSTTGLLLDANVTSMKNNILSSSNGQRAFTYTSHPGNADYNDFYTSGSVLVYQGTATPVSYATLAAYKTGSGTNANGKGVNPKYTNDSNLHVFHPTLLGAGTPFPVVNPILTDIDGDNRNSINPCIGADEFQVPSADVIATQFVGVKKDFPANVPQQLSLKVLNNGSAFLNQVKIRWSVNGVEQLPAYTWAGSLAYDSSQTVNFGAYQFEMMKYSTLKIWTDLPNGVPDMTPANDTIRVDSIMPYARGNFTIGGASPYLPGFLKAGVYLNYGGVDSAVNIVVRNGKYTEQPVIKYTRGASLTNLITFRGENNQAALDTLTFSATGAGAVPYATVKLDSANYYTFKNITFQSLSTTYSREIELHNKTRFISFDSCVFTSVATNANYPHIEQGTIAADSNFVFTNNIFQNGAYGGIKMALRNGIIKGNRFESLNDQSSNGAVLELSGSGNNSFLIVDSNYVKNPLVCTFSFGGNCYSYGTNSVGGINITYSGTNNDISVTRNKIYAIGRRAITISSSGSAALPVKVYNNFFSSNTGIGVFSGAYIDLAFNSFGDSTNNANPVIEIQNANNSFRNNIVYKSSPGQSFTTQNLLRINNTTNAASFVSNNNAFYFNDTARLIYNGSASVSLSQWQTATGKDLQSVRTTAAYNFFNSDLHIDKNKPGALDIYKKGMPLANVPKDIDDSTRSLTNPSIGADEFSINNTDAGAMAITNLNFPVALGSNNVIGSIRNYGNNNLTSASVNWSVNGALQTPYAWSGNIATGDSAVNLPIGTFNFTTPGKYIIRVWTSSPNGIADQNIINDSTSKTVYPALCGSYTIAGTTPDFTSLSTASAYVSLAGITCPVVFNIRDGNFNESDTINFIPGSSATNTVTFQSQSLDSSKVSFSQSEYTGANTSSVLFINGAQHVKFKALTFKRVLDPSYHFYFDVVSITGNATGTSFTNCALTTTGPGKLIFANSITASSDYTFSSNVFTGGTNGVMLYGPSSGYINNIVIKDNKFIRPIGSANTYTTTYTIDLQNAGASNIENNYLDSTSTGNLLGGININASLGKLTVLKNIILKRKGANGINMQYNTGGSVYDSAVVIANNFVTVDSSAATIGIYVQGMGRNGKIVYNNILNNSSSSNSRALQFSNSYNTGTLKDTIANNNMVSMSAGYGLYFQQNNSGDVNCSNNNIYVAGSAIIANYAGTNYTTVAALPTTGGTNTGNVSKNPLYTNSSNLHVGELSLRLDGKPLPYVLNDIDNDVRGTVNSTIGADEIVISSLDIGITSLVTPAKPFAVGNQNITVAIKNYGSTAITGATVNWSVNGTLQTPYTFSGSILFNTTANATIANYSFAADSAYNMKFWTSAPNGGTDASNTNDSLISDNIYPALSGVYTLGGSTPDFKSFKRSAANLKFGGVLGNVTFNVRDGRYNESMIVDSIPFQNNYNILWQSESADSSKVLLAYTPVLNDNTLGVLQLNNTKNITFKKIGFQVKIPAVNPSGTYLSVVYFSKRNKNVQFISNRFIDSTYTSSPYTTGSRFFFNRDQAASNNNYNYRSADSALVIDRNYFKQVNLSTATVIDLGGNTVTDFSGNTTVNSYLNNITISNNKFNMQLLSKPGIDISYADSIRLLSNKLTGNVTVNGKDLMIIDKNDIYHEGYSQNAVTVTSTLGRAINKPVIISNNTIQTVRVGTYNGNPVGNNALNIFGDRFTIIHNTIATSDTGNITGWNTSAALNMINSKFDTVKNNILYNVNGGYLINQQTVTNLVSNNNDYVYSRNFSTNAVNLAAYKTLYAQDAQSVENINPYFRGPKDLHASNILLKTASAITPANALFTADIDGQARTAPACMGADEFLQPANDMIVLNATPRKIFPTGINDFKINVYNNGSNAITGFTATASLTNFPDGYTATNAGNLNYTFAGNIAPGATQEITLGQMSVPLYRNILKVNTNNLNGGTDEVRFNDTLQYDNYYAGLNGTYTFKDYIYQDNRTATFNTFNDLTSQLKFGGVYGPSTVNLLSGLYATSFYADSIPNRGALSPLVIQSQNGDSSSTGFSYLYGHGFTMYKANNVTIKNLYFGQPSAYAFYSGMILGYNSQNITVQNCRFKRLAYNGSGTDNFNIYISGNWQGQTGYTDSNYTIKNNFIEGGYQGIYFSGASFKEIRNNVISNNTFLNQGSVGINLTVLKNTIVDSNTISTNYTDPNYIGISGESNVGKMKYTRNRVYVEKDGVGIKIREGYSASYALTDTLLIANNFVTTGNSQASIATDVQIGNKKQTGIYYNSMLNRSSNSAAISLKTYALNNFGGRFEVLNNIMYNKTAGPALSVNKDANITYVQHNDNLFTAGAVLAQVNGTSYTTLSALAATGVDYNSVSANPLYISDIDLHSDAAAVNNVGSYDANGQVGIDIDNESRSNNTPDIGADEFKLPNFGAVELETPLSSCSHTAAEPVKAWIKNFGFAPRTNVPVAYRINAGTIVRDTVRVTINPADSVLFTFTQTANLLSPLDYNFEVFTNYRGDSLPSNDTFRVLVATTTANNVLPYYTGFEGTNAGWYTGGQNSSFKWGVVFSGVIDSAANGLNAWKSNLTGPHKNNENSYLYSPCFDLTAVSADPVLNFNLAYQLENNTDKAWVEYSINAGATWTKLGAQGDGRSWYNNAGNYWTGNNALWHNAKHLLPISSVPDRSAIRVRFVLQTNNTVVQDGLAIDDVSIYVEGNTPVSSGTYTNRTAVSSGTGTFVQVNDPSGNRIIEVNDNGQTLGTISVDVNQNVNNAPTLYNGNSYLGRSFVIHVQNAPVAPVKVRLFITQAEFDAWKAADPTIDQVRSLSVYKFSGTVEDFSLSNNTGGTPLTISAAQITKIPYLDGYFLEFNVSSFSEFWITKTGGGAVVVPVNFVDVKARLQNDKTLVSWQVANEQNVSHYDIMHSTDGNSWRSVGRVGYQGGNTLYNFTHNAPADGINYYQIKQVDINGPFMLSNVVSVNKGKAVSINVYPTVFTSTFKVDNGSNKKGMIQLYSADGKAVMQYPLNAGITTVNAAILAKGIYLYKIIIDGVVSATGRMIKE